jgi:hypothetical protein
MAASRPIPDVAPVTNATLSFKIFILSKVFGYNEIDVFLVT